MIQGSLAGADGIEFVWNEWMSYIESNNSHWREFLCYWVLVAWGGKKPCDCEWPFKVTVDGFYDGSYQMPSNCLSLLHHGGGSHECIL